MRDAKKYLDTELTHPEHLAEIEKQGREPDCYLVFKSRDRQLVGGPVEIYGTKAGLYKQFPKLVKKIDERYDIEVCTWWFDD